MLLLTQGPYAGLAEDGLPKPGRLLSMLVGMAVVTMAWTAIESVLENSRTAPEIITALAGSHGAEIERMLDRIGAGDAVRLLEDAQQAHPAERRVKLDACLTVLDKAVVAGGQPGKGALPRLGRRRREQASNYGDLAQCALLASLIGIELGNEPEIGRARFADAAMALETHVAAARESAAGEDTEAWIKSARGVFVQVGRLLRTDGG